MAKEKKPKKKSESKAPTKNDALEAVLAAATGETEEKEVNVGSAESEPSSDAGVNGESESNSDPTGAASGSSGEPDNEAGKEEQGLGTSGEAEQPEVEGEPTNEHSETTEGTPRTDERNEEGSPESSRGDTPGVPGPDSSDGRVPVEDEGRGDEPSGSTESAAGIGDAGADSERSHEDEVVQQKSSRGDRERRPLPEGVTPFDDDSDWDDDTDGDPEVMQQTTPSVEDFATREERTKRRLDAVSSLKAEPTTDELIADTTQRYCGDLPLEPPMTKPVYIHQKINGAQVAWDSKLKKWFNWFKQEIPTPKGLKPVENLILPDALYYGYVTENSGVFTVCDAHSYDSNGPDEQRLAFMLSVVNALNNPALKPVGSLVRIDSRDQYIDLFGPAAVRNAHQKLVSPLSTVWT